MSQSAAISLGGNATSSAGEPRLTLAAALAKLFAAGVEPVAASRFYRSPAVPAGSGPDFVNAAALVRTTLGPGALLAHLHAIEAMFGRVREARWGARTLDLDLLLYGDAVLPDPPTERRWRELPEQLGPVETPPTLILPHPRLAERAFVLVPLCEIAATLRHPATGRTVAEMREGLGDAAAHGVVPL
ncbi:MAG: 2-amino-4-hydroxy-6-hydroxymethyldihydropteridine diphosphokinase [Paracoccaceae bacterium]